MPDSNSIVIYERSFKLAWLVCTLFLVGCLVHGRESAKTVLMRTSGGTAPSLLAKLEVFDDGCVRYRSTRSVLRRCGLSSELVNALDDVVVSDIAFALIIAPQNRFDHEGLSLQHGSSEAARANEDLPLSVRRWLGVVDRALRLELGPEYEPFLNSSLK